MVRAGVVTTIGWFVPLVAVFVCAPTLLQALGKQAFGTWMIGALIPATVAQLDFGWSTFAVRWLLRDKSRTPAKELQHVPSIPLHVLEANEGAAARFNANTKLMGAGKRLAEAPCLFLIGLAIGAIGAALTAIVLLIAGQVLGLVPLSDQSSATKFAILLSIWSGLSLATSIWSAYWRAGNRLVSLALVQAFGGGGLWVLSSVAAMEGASLVSLAALSTAWYFLCVLPIVRSILFVSWQGLRYTLTQLLNAYWTERAFVGGIVGAQVASQVTYQSDRYILAALAGPAAVGVYSVLSGLASKLVQVLAAGTSVLFPRAARLNSDGNKDRLEDLFVRVSQLLIVLLTAFVFVGFWAAEEFLQLWLRAAYSIEYVIALQWLIVAAGLASTSLAASNFYIASGKSALSLRYAWSGAFITATSCLLLIPSFGVFGAAVAVCFGCLQAPVFAEHVRRLLGFNRVFNLRLIFALGAGCLVALIPQLTLRDAPTSWLKVIALSSLSFLSILSVCGLLIPGLKQLMRRPTY